MNLNLKNKRFSRILRLSVFSLALFLFSPAIPFYAWNLQGACAGSPYSASVGTPINWTATQSSTPEPTASGHDAGHYEWSWSGTDGLSGVAQSVSKTYTTPGVKTATVTITLA